MRNPRALPFLLLAVAVACGDDEPRPDPEPDPQPQPEPDPDPDPCPAPGRVVGDVCLPPGVADDGCPAGTLGQQDGTCRPAGILAGACAEGFAHVPFESQLDGADGVAGTCEAILPATPCGDGSFAVPGETSCHPVGDCGAGQWGNIPVDQDTVYVDASFVGASDGSAAAPFTTITDAMAAAPEGGLIAVAAGTYAEDITIAGKAVVLQGVCAEQVEISGAAAAAAVTISTGATGTTLRGLAVRGAGRGVQVEDATDVLLSELWIHDGGNTAVFVTGETGATAARIERSLIDSNIGYGVVAVGAEAEVEETAVRRTQERPDGTAGRGVQIATTMQGSPGSLTLRRSLIEQNHDIGVFIYGSSALIEATVVRDTETDTAGIGGEGIAVGRDVDFDLPSDFTIRQSVVEGSKGVGVSVTGSGATIESTVVRATELQSQDIGRGIAIQNSQTTGDGATATITGSVVDDSFNTGLFVGGSQATVESTVVRRTKQAALDQGRGVNVQRNASTSEPSVFVLRGSVVEDSYDVAVFVSSSDASIEASLVRDVAVTPDFAHKGIQLEQDADAGAPSTALILHSVVDRAADNGVNVSGSELTLEGTVVRATESDRLGRGVGVQESPTSGAASSATIRSCLIEDNRETGIFVAGSTVAVERSAIRATRPTGEGRYGRGVHVQYGPAGAPSTFSLLGSAVEDHYDVGVLLSGSFGTIDQSTIRGVTASQDGTAGDGVIVTPSPTGEGSLTVTSTVVGDIARAGVSAFGVPVSLGAVEVECAAFDLDQETFNGFSGEFVDLGDNACGCPEASGGCTPVSAALEAPTLDLGPS